jgi:excisionase family DNA binding protein
MITIKEAATILKVSHMTVRRMIERGTLKPLNEANPALLRQNWLLRRQDVEALLRRPLP